MIVECDQRGIDLAVNVLKKGGLVVYPTDTVYGIGCDPRNSLAVKKIYKLKKREGSRNLPILGYSKEEISKIAIFDEISNKIADRFWPGQITLVLKLKDEEIKKALSLVDKIAVRVPNHTCTLSLLKECRLLIGTSANYSGNPSFSDSKKLLESFSGFDVLVDGGIISNSNESTIVEIFEGDLRILREGGITKKEIISIL